MSVLIKGMEMPKNCWDCPLFCKNSLDSDDRKSQRKADCPLTELPIHRGRLIDADRLLAFIKSAAGNQISVRLSVVLGSIEHAPTVVEAEE